MTVPLLQVVNIFDGDSTRFKQWVKEVECYSQMARLSDADIPRIVHITCKGLVADFIQRYIDECQSDNVSLSW